MTAAKYQNSANKCELIALRVDGDHTSYMNGTSETRLNDLNITNQSSNLSTNSSTARMSQSYTIKLNGKSKSYKKVIIMLALACFLLVTLLGLASIALFGNRLNQEEPNEHKSQDLAFDAHMDCGDGGISQKARLTYNPSQHKGNEEKVECKTKTCYDAAQFILSRLNQSVNPCENFYQFACGSWLKSNQRSEDHFALANRKMLKNMAKILNDDEEEEEEEEENEEIEDENDDEDEDGNKKKNDLIRKFKKYFKSCMNQAYIERNSDRDFIDFMSEEFGKWPLLALTNESSFHKVNERFLDQTEFGFEDHLAKLTIYDMPLLFKFVSDDHQHSQIFMKIIIIPNFCHLQRFFPDMRETDTAFVKLVQSLRQFMLESTHPKTNSSSNEPFIDEQIKDMLLLISEVYSLNNTKYKCTARKPTEWLLFKMNQISKQFVGYSNKSTGKERFDFIHFTKYLNKNAATKLKADSKITTKLLTLGYLNDLFSSLSLLSEKMGRERFRRAFLNFIYFHSLYSLLRPIELGHIQHLQINFPLRYYQAFFEYIKSKPHNYIPFEMFESMYLGHRDENCAYAVLDAFSIVNTNEQLELQRLFLSENVDLNGKNHSLHMLHLLVDNAIRIVNEQTWIDPEHKRDIIKRIEDVEMKIAYSDYIYDPNSKIVESSLGQYKLTKSYLKNYFTLKKKEFEKEYDLLDVQQLERIRSNNYVFGIYLTNLIYLKDFNTLLMPAGVLVEPIFDINNQLYLNYATIGAYISHELWHLIEVALDDLLAYKLNAESCLLTNYVAYAKEKFKLDVSIDKAYNSVSEQIADIFGVYNAFDTYMRVHDQSPWTSEKFKRLPGLNLTPEQLFFVRYAQGYCKSSTVAKNSFEVTHSEDSYRVYQTSFVPKFNQVFGCNSTNLQMFQGKQCPIFNY